MTELFLKILGMSATAALTAAAVLLLRLVLKPAPKIFSYVLWTAVFVRLLIPFSLPLPTSELSPITPVTIRTEPYTYDKSYNQAVPLSVGIDAESEISIYTSETIAEFKKPKTALEIFSVIWLSGVLIMTARWIYSYLRLRKTLKNSRPDGQNIYTSDKISTPFIFGILPPRIYLPESLSGNRRELVILHEKYHIKRLDHIAKLVMYLALCIHWFNPIVWLSFRLCERDMEMSCDEAVTGKMNKSEKADYSEALLEAAPKRSASFTAGFSESGTKRRIKNVLNFKKPALWVMLLCAIAALLAVIVLSSDKTPESTPQAPENAITGLSSDHNPLNDISADDQTVISLITKSGQQYPFSAENNSAALKILSETEFTPTELYEYVPSEFELRLAPKDNPYSFGQYAFAPAKNTDGEHIFSVSVMSTNTDYNYSLPEESYKALKELADLTYNYAMTELDNIPLTIPVIPASPEFLQSVYFGSEFPHLLYANEYDTVFTDGMNGLYLCSDQAVLWAADIGSSFAAYKNEFPFEFSAPSWNGISTGAFTDENGQLRLWCSIGGAMSNHYINYMIDLETNTLNYIDEIPEDTRKVRTYSYYDFSENASRPLDSHILYYDSDPQNFVYLSANKNSFDLSLVKIVRHTSEGHTEFIPFPENSPAIDPQAQSKLHFGTYRLSDTNEELSLNSVTISPLGNASIMFSPLSSFLCIGTAELNADHTKLIVTASDSGRYVFDIDGSSLIYRQNESIEGIAATPKEMSGAYEGAVYIYSEE
ncbi:MAG: M56 family metallopeptidase [Huintestinicola sp.]|uniref:M56 family metallopeptidase n=1 Tax=Huintestinicola sp. TaxID=2981661 RepID=UPI003EFEC2C9